MSSTVSRNIFSLVMSRLLAGVLVFIGYAALFRYLGPLRTGQFQFALAYVLLFGVVVDFGIQQLVIKRVSEHKDEAQTYLGNFFAVEVVIAIFIYALLIVIAQLNHYDPVVRNAIYVAGFGMVLNALTIPHTAIISAYEDMHILAVVNFCDSLINVSMMFLAIVFHRSIVFLASVQLVMGIMHWIVYRYLVLRYIPELHLWRYLKSLDWKLMRNMLLAALPFGTLVGFSIIYNKMDVIIIFNLRGAAETGLYTAADKIFDFLAFFPAVVSSALYPFFSAQMLKGNIAAIRSALENYTKLTIVLGVPIAIGGFVLAARLNLLIAGKDFYQGYEAMQFLVLGVGTLFIYSAVNSMMISQMTRKAVYISFANIVINGVGNLLLVPHFGYRAAGVMSFVSEVIQAFCYFYLVRKHIARFAVLKNFVIPVAAALIMGAVLWPLRMHNLLLTLPLGGAIYIVLLAGSGFIKKNDLNTLKGMLSRRSPETGAAEPVL